MEEPPPDGQALSTPLWLMNQRLQSRLDETARRTTAAVVRFEWVARQTWKDGKVTDTHMAVLMVWLRQGESWQLLARSATKLG